MGRRKIHRNKSEDEFTQLAIRIERYEADADASISHDVYYPQYASIWMTVTRSFASSHALPSTARQPNRIV
jgi:hypothetical protein